MKKIATYFAFCCFTAVPGLAQMFTGFVGAGPSVPLNPFAGHTTNPGWNLSAGAGVTTNHVGMMLDFLYTDMTSNPTNSNAHTWGFTLDPVVHLTQEGPVDLYFTGGGGIYHSSLNFTNPNASSAYKGGLDGGLGVSFKLGPTHLKAFAEARYHYIFTSPVATTIIPVTVGLRW
jgi:hypothetical protein